MDLDAQNKLANEVEQLLAKRLKKHEFYAAIAAVERGNGFVFSIGTLNERSVFQNCSLIVSGIGAEAKEISDRFKIPSDKKINKPVEPK